MAYEIRELPTPTPRGETHLIADTEYDIVWSRYHRLEDAEADLVTLNRDEEITASFDAWIHAKAEEHGIRPSEIANQLDVHQFR
tara:strand:+ start:156 stop:407 length:252 start_codon:yes stop_codon:yes gene_type:complete